MGKEKFENEVALLTLGYIRKTSNLNENSTPEDFAKEYRSAFSRISEKLKKLGDELKQSNPKPRFHKSDLGL